MIEVKNLTKCYGNHVVLDDISFHIKPGQTVGFLGNNGVGKSTTMNIITGYLSATAGTVTVGGYDIVKEPLKAKKLIGYLPENPPLYNELTVTEYLNFACEIKGVEKKKRKEQIEEVIDVLKIDKMRNRLISNLSRGYKQRVGLAQALCGDPKVLILDEPTVGLDPTQIIDIRKTIKKLGGKHTIVLSSHILHEVADICDHILMLHKGKIVVNDTLTHMIGTANESKKLTVRLRCDSARAQAVLQGIPGITNIQIVPTGKSAETELIMDSIPEYHPTEAIARAVVAQKIGLIRLTDMEATLEDIFLSHTRES